MAKSKLILEDGTIFEGYAFGKDREVSGEIVFSTGMVGYPEGLTDPSYKGQILVMTYPLIGNYGIPGNGVSFESQQVHVRGLVVGSYINEYSHWQAKTSLNEWLISQNVPAVWGIDTRALTIKLREKGVMLGWISHHAKNEFSDPTLENLVSQVSIKKPVLLGKGKKKILLIDCGVKEGIIINLLQRKMQVLRVPWDFDLNDFSFNGVVISNGPGDPKMLTQTIKNVKKIINKKIPVLGICLGNQILALAGGADTYKMKFGHRSANQPVRIAGTNHCYLTTQNHGFAVMEKSLSSDWTVWFRNLNDHTVEGIKHKSLPFMSVQFHPEGRPGPYDTNWVFDYFIKTLEH